MDYALTAKDISLIQRCCRVIEGCTTQAQLDIAREYMWLTCNRINKDGLDRFFEVTIASKRKRLKCI